MESSVSVASLFMNQVYPQIQMQSCILAGGVAVGVCLSAVHQPWEAMTIGFSAAVLSTLGFRYLKVFSTSRGQKCTVQTAFAS